MIAQEAIQKIFEILSQFEQKEANDIIYEVGTIGRENGVLPENPFKGN